MNIVPEQINQPAAPFPIMSMEKSGLVLLLLLLVTTLGRL